MHEQFAAPSSAIVRACSSRPRRDRRTRTNVLFSTMNPLTSTHDESLSRSRVATRSCRAIHEVCMPTMNAFFTAAASAPRQSFAHQLLSDSRAPQFVEGKQTPKDVRSIHIRFRPGRCLRAPSHQVQVQDKAGSVARVGGRPTKSHAASTPTEGQIRHSSSGCRWQLATGASLQAGRGAARAEP